MHATGLVLIASVLPLLLAAARAHFAGSMVHMIRGPVAMLALVLALSTPAVAAGGPFHAQVVSVSNTPGTNELLVGLGIAKSIDTAARSGTTDYGVRVIVNYVDNGGGSDTVDTFRKSIKLDTVRNPDINSNTDLISLLVLLGPVPGNTPSFSVLAAVLAPPGQCPSLEGKLAGKKIAGLANCDAKAVSHGLPLSDPGTQACLAKVRAKFSTAWDKIQAGGCATLGDKSAVENMVDAHLTDLESTIGIVAGSRCSSGHLKGAGKKGACRLACASKAAIDRLPVTDPTIVACLKACTDKFGAACAKDETTGDCVNKGACGSVEAKVDTFVDDVTGEIACTDAVKDADEGDVDCGGTHCAPCADFRACNGATDCQSGHCRASSPVPFFSGSTVCIPTSCFNGVRDNESDVDCGVSCLFGCAPGQMCPGTGFGDNCSSASCSGGGTCQFLACCQAPTCTDRIQNQDETDVDCGGTHCPACGDYKACNTSSDCTSGHCVERSLIQIALPTLIQHLCLPVHCFDGVKDNGESDVDCGEVCVQCASGKTCSIDFDCVSLNHCPGGVCCGEPGAPCNANADCCSSVCRGVVCCGAPGAFCQTNTDCCSGTCNGSTLTCK